MGAPTEENKKLSSMCYRRLGLSAPSHAASHMPNFIPGLCSAGLPMRDGGIRPDVAVDAVSWLWEGGCYCYKYYHHSETVGHGGLTLTASFQAIVLCVMFSLFRILWGGPHMVPISAAEL